MKDNRGKQFEIKFREDWIESFPNSFLIRLYDAMGGFLSICTPCDYIAFNNKRLFLLELKSHKENTIPFSAIPQYDRLLKYKDYEDVYPYIIVWFIDHDKVIAVPIKEAEKMVNDGCKSINIKMLDEKKYRIIDIPSKKLRVLMDSDYNILLKDSENY